MWNAAFCNGLYFYVARWNFEKKLFNTFHLKWKGIYDKCYRQGWEQGQFALSPRVPKQCWTHSNAHLSSTSLRGSFHCIVDFKSACFFALCLCCLDANFNAHFILLCSPLARAPVRHTFWSETAKVKQRQKCKYFTDHTCIILTCSSGVLYKPTVGTPLTNYIY